MKISVIIPSHNRRHILADALESVRAQSRRADEVIVIDDRSSDGTPDLIRDNYPNVTLIQTDFGNAAAARHAGIEQSKGDWLAFLDSDDLWMPTHLQTAEEVLNTTGDAAYFAHRHFFRTDSGPKNPIRENGFPFDEVRSNLSDRDFTELFAPTRYFPMATLVLSKQRYQECGGFDSSQVRRHDIDLFLRAIHKHTWSYNPEVQALMRVGDSDRISANRTECDFYFFRCLMRCKALYPNDPHLRWLRRRAAAIAAGSAGRAKDREALRSVLELGRSELILWRRAYWSARMLTFR